MTQEPHPTPTPLFLLTGFLGAGKTTLLTHLMASARQKIAVLENEFAQVGIDQDLLPQAAVMEVSNGSICCTSRADLGLSLGRLARERHRYDHLVIETTGMADPGPILHALLTDEELCEQFHLQAVLVVVDAKHGVDQLSGPREIKAQVTLADLLIINKVDLVSADELGSLERHLRGLNPAAEILRTSHGQVDADALLSGQRFSLGETLRRAPRLLEDTSHEHESSVGSLCLEEQGPFQEARLRGWLRGLVDKGHLLRMKGFLPVEDRWLLVQSVRQQLELSASPSSMAGTTGRLVLIGEDLEAVSLQNGLLDCRL
jgi:G3E family GTPase